MLFDEIMQVLRERYGAELDRYPIPPPIFTYMKGEFTAFDAEAGRLTTRFPVKGDYSNPYGIMQGGMIATAVDNTIGPLSMIVAPPSVTRVIELTYSRQVDIRQSFIEVEARWLGQQDRWLTFSARVRDPEGQSLARAKAKHWIVSENL